MGIVSLLLADERVDPQIPDRNEAIPLSLACQFAHVDIAAMLLADSRVIDVNQERNTGATAFFKACQNGHVDVVSLMLEDKRVDVNKTEHTDSTPLWFAAQNGHLKVVEVLLASGREIDTWTKSSFNETTAAQQARFVAEKEDEDAGDDEGDDAGEDRARRARCVEIANLLGRYQENPDRVRLELRRKLHSDGKRI